MTDPTPDMNEPVDVNVADTDAPVIPDPVLNDNGSQVQWNDPNYAEHATRTGNDPYDTGVLNADGGDSDA